MNNHYHIVAYIDKETANKLSDHNVIIRWSLNHELPPLLTENGLDSKLNSATQQAQLKHIVNIWRQRLSSLSWFIKELNDDITYLANKKENDAGYFWESSYKSQVLLDDKALINAMIFVDLTPIRENNQQTIEYSHTSICERINIQKKQSYFSSNLKPFKEETHTKNKTTIPYHFTDYLDLIQWSSIHSKEEKVFKTAEIPNIITQLGISPLNWLTNLNSAII